MTIERHDIAGYIIGCHGKEFVLIQMQRSE